jgi:hypothetical protein
MNDPTRREMPTALGIGGPVTQITTARGGRVYELGHVEGQPQVPSVTSIVDGTMRNYGLEIWRQQHIERGLEAHRGKTLSGAAIERITTASSSEAQASAALGTEMHSIIERILRGEEATVPEQLEPAVQGFLKWRSEFGGWELQGSEVAVYHESLGYAGTVDAVWYDPVAEQYIVVDWKTSSGIYPSALMQVEAYAHALEDMLFHSRRLAVGTAVRGMVVRFGNDYPRVNGKKNRTQPKVFSDKIEYVWSDTGWLAYDGWPAFEACLVLSRASKAKLLTGRL